MYKFGNKDQVLPFCLMRPTTSEARVQKLRDVIYQAKGHDYRDGFKGAYKEFLKAYARRDFKILEFICESNLCDAIKAEPKPSNNEIVYSYFEHPNNKQVILEFDVVDYNYVIGADIDRRRNNEKFLCEVFDMPASLFTFYGPRSIFGFYNMLRSILKWQKNKNWRLVIPNINIWVLLRFKTNVVVCEK